jgi:asparagine synthetase B (glutamine-hydrolysing)
MCGLTGYWRASGHSTQEAQAIVGAMARQITHRGPDDQGGLTLTQGLRSPTAACPFSISRRKGTSRCCRIARAM